ncbi:hypothetical protein L345_10828, partial [Ophiophagus hannah]
MPLKTFQKLEAVPNAAAHHLAVRVVVYKTMYGLTVERQKDQVEATHLVSSTGMGKLPAPCKFCVGETERPGVIYYEDLTDVKKTKKIGLTLCKLDQVVAAYEQFLLSLEAKQDQNLLEIICQAFRNK